MKSTQTYSHNNPINWYPGHMLKAKKELIARLKHVDVVLELRDARIPLASVNQDFEPILKQKKRVILLNKTGLADEKKTQLWHSFFEKNQIMCHFIDVKQNQGVKNILPSARSMMEEKWERFKKKGIRPPSLKLMIVGIPNVGKSSLINKMVRKNAAETGPMPGVTKRQEWIKLGKNIELLDTPGILWPKFENPETGFELAITGAIKDRVAGEERLSDYLIQYYIKHYPSNLYSFYKLVENRPAERRPNDIKDPEGGLSLGDTSQELLAAIARKRGCLKAGGEVDLLRASKMLLRDFRSGNLGRVTFEIPPETN